jgi:alanyl-tRNA synthetase
MDEMQRGYLSDPLLGEFTARVTKVEDAGDGARKVWLDRTLFYPESGGQPDDRGTLGGFKVEAVSEEGPGVCHLVRGALEVGDEINGHVDMARRFDHMQQHTGQHILSRVFVSLGGLMTVGFHLGEKASTIDLSGRVTDETIAKAEREANAVVFQDLPVEARIITRDEYESAKESGDAVRSRLPDGVGSIRIIEIEDTDSSTCCGTHCLSTGMVGIIKITGTENVRGGTRVEFLCGGRALGDYGEKHALLAALGGGMSTDWRELGNIVEKLVSENKSLRRERDALLRELAGFRAAEISKPAGEIGGFALVRKVFEQGSAVEVREMASKIRESGKNIVLFGIVSPAPGLVFACEPSIPADMSSALREAAAVIGGKGGGGRDFAQGGGGDPSRMEEALDAAEKKIRETLE